MIASYFYRDRRPVNLLAAVALGFLVFDPEQLFEASFQLTFLAVAFLGVFAMPFIAATTGPLARGLTDLGDTARDLHLEPRVAQFRIEMRLLAETLRGALRVPAGAARGAVAFVGRVLFFFFEVTVISAVIQIGLALPMVVYFHRVGLSGLSANALVVPVMGLVVPVGFVAPRYRLAVGGSCVRLVAGREPGDCAMACLGGAELADSDAAVVGGPGIFGGADSGGGGARKVVAHGGGTGGGGSAGGVAVVALSGAGASRAVGAYGDRCRAGR